MESKAVEKVGTWLQTGYKLVFGGGLVGCCWGWFFCCCFCCVCLLGVLLFFVVVLLFVGWLRVFLEFLSFYIDKVQLGGATLPRYQSEVVHAQPLGGKQGSRRCNKCYFFPKGTCRKKKKKKELSGKKGTM